MNWVHRRAWQLSDECWRDLGTLVCVLGLGLGLGLDLGTLVCVLGPSPARLRLLKDEGVGLRQRGAGGEEVGLKRLSRAWWDAGPDCWLMAGKEQHLQLWPVRPGP